MNNVVLPAGLLLSVHRKNVRLLSLWVISLQLIFNCMAASAEPDWAERRRDQFPVSTAHLVVPLPYSYPGIGDGFFLMGNFSNLLESTADFLGIYVTGDASGYVLQADEVPLIDRRLFVRLFYQNINRAQINQYDVRGMEGTSENEYTLLDISLARNKSAEFNLTFFERRINFTYEHKVNEYEVEAVRDNNGGLITELDDPYYGKESKDTIGFYVDLTDDYLDPLKGMRFSLQYLDQPAETSDNPSFYVLTYNLSFYVPIQMTNTLVFNYFQSDAHVTSKGNTNPADIRAELGLNCDPLDTECLDSEQKLVDVFINQRTNGTSASLGGKDRLRSYPQDRFNGAHSGFFGVEYRWNFKQEVAPFNYLFWKDVRTGLQVAFFGEVGTVSEKSSDLWAETRYSYGAGVRLVAASGAVYRADIANGQEGAELTIFFFYPW